MSVEKSRIDLLISVIRELLDALDAPTPESCDCGGSSLCAVCNAYRVLQVIEVDYHDTGLTVEKELEAT